MSRSGRVRMTRAPTANTVAVTATLSDGLKWGTILAPWTYVDPATATIVVELTRHVV